MEERKPSEGSFFVSKSFLLLFSLLLNSVTWFYLIIYIWFLTPNPLRFASDLSMIFFVSVMVSMLIGPIIAEMKQRASDNKGIPLEGSPPMSFLVRETNLDVPFKFTTDNYQLLSKLICFDTSRNKLIVNDILEQTTLGRRVLLLSERKDHLEVLRLYLKGMCETIVVSGEDSIPKRDVKFRQICAGHYQVILSTGQFFGEGLDNKNIDCLILAFPFSFEGKLIQYLGRLRGIGKLVIDYNDGKIPFLGRQFKQRQRCYRKFNFFEMRERIEVQEKRGEPI